MSRTPWQMLNGNRTRVAATLVVLLAIAALMWHFAGLGNRTLAHRFVAGQRLVYRLEYISASAADFSVMMRDTAKEAVQARNGQPNDEQAIFTTVEADLQATVLEVNAGGALIACVLRDPKVRVVFNGDLAQPQAEAIQTDLSRMLLAVVDLQGRIRSVHLDPKVSALSHTFVRALLAATQIVLPGDPAQSVWETREADPNGEYAARYQFETIDGEEPNIAVYSKERTHYLPRPRQHSIRKLDVESIARPSGNLTVRFDLAAGRVQSVSGTEATTICVDERVVARAETTVRMHFQSSETLSKSEQQQLARTCASLTAESAIALSAHAPTADQEAGVHRNELGDATLEGLLAELARLEARADANEGDTPLYLKLKALVYLQPEACPRLAETLGTAPTQSRTMQLLTGALSSIGHARAQSALQSALRARTNDEPALAMLVAALAMVETPTESSEETLRELAATTPHANIRASAELGLGTMAHQLAIAQPQRAARIVRAVTAKLTQATSADARRHCLFVLGNAGASESLEPIAPYLSDTAPEVRAAAAAALRWIEADEADRLLCSALANDADVVVRVEAATALGFRLITPATFAAQKNAFLKDANTSVRLALMPNFARAINAYPEGRTLLTQAANDASGEVREEAANLLAID